MAVTTLPAVAAPTSTGRAARITGWTITGLVTLFLLFDSVTKLLALPPVGVGAGRVVTAMGPVLPKG